MTMCRAHRYVLSLVTSPFKQDINLGQCDPSFPYSNYYSRVTPTYLSILVSYIFYSVTKFLVILNIYFLLFLSEEREREREEKRERKKKKEIF